MPARPVKSVFALINILLVLLLNDEVNKSVSPVSSMLSKLIASPSWVSAVTNTESNWAPSTAK